MPTSYYYENINPQELAEQLNDENIAVIDVRDDDFDVDGFIPGATNSPSKSWSDVKVIDELISSHEGKQKVIFHCMHSQARGPSCARRYLDRRSELRDENDSNLPVVMVLAGGFGRWKELYAGVDGMVATSGGVSREEAAR